MLPKIYISLVIEEESIDLDILKILNKLGATTLWIKGERKNNTIKTHKNNGCAFEAQPVLDINVDYAIRYFWETFKIDDIGLLEVVEKYNLSPVLTIAIYMYDIMPAIHLESFLVKKLAHFNIGLDIDIMLTE